MAPPPPPLPVRRLVDDDPVDPGAQRRLAAELRERAEHAQEHFLRQVQRFLRVAEQMQRQLVDHPLMVGDQPRAGVLVAGGTLLHQRPIGAGGVWPRQCAKGFTKVSAAMVAPRRNAFLKCLDPVGLRMFRRRPGRKMNTVKWMLVVVAILGSVAGGVVARSAHGPRPPVPAAACRRASRPSQTGNTYAAIEAFSGALALRPDSMVAYYRRGEAYHAQTPRRRGHPGPARGQPAGARRAAAARRARRAVYDAGTSRSAQAADWYGQAADAAEGRRPGAALHAGARPLPGGSPGGGHRPAAPGDRAQRLGRPRPTTCSASSIATRNRSTRRSTRSSRRSRSRRRSSPAREELADLYRAQGRPVDEMAQLQALAALDRNDDRQIAIALAEARGADSSTRRSARSSDASPSARRRDSHVQLAHRPRLSGARRADAAIADRRSARWKSLEQALGGTARRSEGLALFGRALYLSGDDARGRAHAARGRRRRRRSIPRRSRSRRRRRAAGAHRRCPRRAHQPRRARRRHGHGRRARRSRAAHRRARRSQADDPKRAADYLDQAVDAGRHRRRRRSACWPKRAGDPAIRDGAQGRRSAQGARAGSAQPRSACGSRRTIK